ncbi:EPM2AIP1, partial [Cordylochernes scorpioides]
MEKKRKIDSECRKFKDQWNIQYFVIESSNKALCLICNESIAVLKEYNMKRHYETKHSQNYSKYTGIVRTEKFEALKRGLKSQQSLFTKVKTEQEAEIRASFRVALEIAKRGKPFTDGEMIKECIIAVVEEMCPEKVNLLKTVSLSANTVARRVENIAENISSQLFDKNGPVEWFSLALDESTDVSDTAQVLIYIRGVDKSYEVHEELLDMYSIHGTTTGTDIFKGVEMAINKKNLRWKNLKCITTDGGKNMSGKDKGVVALVSKAVENDGGSKPLVFHCIIHQQSLCGKCLDMSDVLKPVISTVNFIRSFGLNHRQFRQFIAEIGETDLPYNTAVRWLSCGKVLQRFFELRAVIEIFLNEKHRPLTELQNNAWLWKLAFYVDLTKHVNELNLRLQGENQHLPDLYTNIKSFRMKLILFQSQLRSKCFSHFKTCEIFSHNTETEFPIDFAIETLSALKINFDTHFSDFDAIANQIKIFQNPFDADIETLAPELQMEMIDLQCSDIIKNKYENSSLLEFYKSLPLTQFDNLHKFARGLFSVFGTTYLCEKTFSKMNRMEKKRKIDSECRKFKDQWNIQYFVIESSNKALCLICNESIAVLKEYNMKRHYETKHSQNYSKYTGIVRTEKFEALKRGLKSQQSLFTKVKTEQEAATRASFRVALEIAKRGKPFTDGEMIKECIIAVVEEMCPEKVNLLKTVSMSANTVARRVENIAENISSQLFDKNGHVEWFSLALDESTDVSDTAQVLIYIRGVDKSYEVHEELLDMYSIHGTTTGTDIFKGVEMAINKKNLRWKNLKCITTDGGKNMSGKDKGVVALVSKAVENDGGSKPLVFHCIIHQQSLCGKCLDMSDVLKPVISTVNFIRSFGLNHRQFRQFIAEIGETDLPYNTAVRWLSCGKVLQRFFELRAVIEIFLNEKHRPLTELQNNAWLWKLAFYVDLTKHVNELNLRLQGENQHLPDLYTNIKSFRMKLILFQSQLRSKCFSHFKTCEIFSHTTETKFPIDFAIETLSALKINFDTRFSDFDAIANQIKIFQNTFDADIETLAPELQMEMIDLQCSDIIKNKYENSSLLEFYKSLPLTQFDNLHKFARGLFSVFGTTYL